MPLDSPPTTNPIAIHTIQTTSIRDVTLVRGTTTVFDHLTLQLDETRIGLIGDNGAGKSSLFRLLCGLDTPRSGTVQVRGCDIRQAKPQRAQSVGMLFQNPEDQIIFPTVEEELAFSLHTMRLPRQAVRARTQEFLAARGLAHWAGRTIGSLSQGQRQHVCWLALLIAAPQVLLLDEPFSSLDLPGRVLLDQEIAHATQQIILSTHLLDHVRDFARVIWLDKGQVRADGLGRDVCAAYEADVTQRTTNRILGYGKPVL